MEFLKFIRSVEEFLYELMTWLIFYPRTLWLATRHPLRLAGDADAEMEIDDTKRFSSLISPPLFLMLTVLLAWLMESALHIGLGQLPSGSLFARQIAASPTNLLAFRVAAFSVIPLAMALGLLWRQGLTIDRQTLRRPFYLQCFLAGPFVLALSIAMDLMRLSQTVPAQGLAVAACVWFLAVETAWFRRQIGVSSLAAFVLVGGLFIGALVLVIAVSLLMVGPLASAG
jgi:hypothetical protein